VRRFNVTGQESYTGETSILIIQNRNVDVPIRREELGERFGKHGIREFLSECLRR
jgi:hypothetical protein